jgi:hypothetical protein
MTASVSWSTTTSSAGDRSMTRSAVRLEQRDLCAHARRRTDLAQHAGLRILMDEAVGLVPGNHGGAFPMSVGSDRAGPMKPSTLPTRRRQPEDPAGARDGARVGPCDGSRLAQGFDCHARTARLARGVAYENTGDAEWLKLDDERPG